MWSSVLTPRGSSAASRTTAHATFVEPNESSAIVPRNCLEAAATAGGATARLLAPALALPSVYALARSHHPVLRLRRHRSREEEPGSTGVHKRQPEHHPRGHPGPMVADGRQEDLHQYPRWQRIQRRSPSTRTRKEEVGVIGDCPERPLPTTLIATLFG